MNLNKEHTHFHIHDSASKECDGEEHGTGNSEHFHPAMVTSVDGQADSHHCTAH